MKTIYLSGIASGLSDKSVFPWFFMIALGFLSGSVLYSKLIPRLFLKKDICQAADDKNPGASNVFKTCGIGWGLLCLALDLCKAYLPVRYAMLTLGTESLWFAAVMIAPVAGHAVGLFDSFHGGKCIAACFGVMIALLDRTPIGLLLAALYIFFSTVWRIRPNRKRSILTFSLFGFLSLVLLILQRKLSLALGSFGLSLIAVFRHLCAPDALKSEAVQKSAPITEEHI